MAVRVRYCPEVKAARARQDMATGRSACGLLLTLGKFSEAEAGLVGVTQGTGDTVE